VCIVSLAILLKENINSKSVRTTFGWEYGGSLEANCKARLKFGLNKQC
jgi:hypothetical protein